MRRFDGNRLVLATHNAGKVRELRQLLAGAVPGLDVDTAVVDAGACPLQPTTVIGTAPRAPNTTYCAGSSVLATSTISPATAKLAHQGERSKIANRELGAILNFTERLW